MAYSESSFDSESLLETAKRYQGQLIVGVLVVAAAVGGLWMMKSSRSIKEARAADALVAGQRAYEIRDVATAQAEFQKVMERYAGTTAGTQAGMMAAQLAFEAGMPDSGLAKLATVASKAPKHYRASVYALQAAGEAQAGRPAEAAKLLVRAAESAQFEVEADQYRLEAARAYVAASDVAAAKAIYEGLVKREDSSAYAEARVRLGEIAFTL